MYIESKQARQHLPWRKSVRLVWFIAHLWYRLKLNLTFWNTYCNTFPVVVGQKEAVNDQPVV